MSLLIGALALSALVGAQAGAQASALEAAFAPASESLEPARQWLALIDGRDWDGSWRAAAGLFRGQITAPQWASTIEPVRQPLGQVSSRKLQGATRTRTLPGVPAGDYEVLQFGTDFAGKSGAVETVIMMREESGWKVAGYFVR